MELYVHTGGETAEAERVFLCRPGVDNNVAECFLTDGIPARAAADRIANSVNAVTQIVALLDGKEWNSETICDVAHILREEGFGVRDVLEPFVIRGAMDGDERLYWSNTDGWVSRDSATVFDGEEWKTIADPIGATGREGA